MVRPTLMLIHGYPFDHTLWNSVVAELGDSCRILAPDLPGFGDNPVAITEPSIDVMADQIAELLELHHTPHAVVAGMSLGGYVALAFAERHPDRLAALALISSQAGADTAEVQAGRRKLIESVRHSGVTVAVEAALPKLFSDSAANKPALIEQATSGAEKAGVDGICWALEAMARRPDRTKVLKTLRVPLAILHGTEDKFIPVAKARELAANVKGSQLVEISGAGHATPLESAREVAAVLKDLCKRGVVPILSQEEKAHAHGERPGVIWGPTEKGL